MCKPATPGRDGYNQLPRQHHQGREIWATCLDVAWVTGNILLSILLSLAQMSIIGQCCEAIIFSCQELIATTGGYRSLPLGLQLWLSTDPMTLAWFSCLSDLRALITGSGECLGKRLLWPPLVDPHDPYNGNETMEVTNIHQPHPLSERFSMQGIEWVSENQLN